ncbi:MAG: ATP-binding protein [Leptolyngbyaceae bacterium]|nr:ATP-binding protein [Leptolyngbyaceae bacterium]
MSETLTIQDFAGIKYLEIEIKKINILIGPQASGKSICAKILFYFKSFVWNMLSVIENEQTKRELDADFRKTFEEYFPPSSWGKQNFCLRYEVGDLFIEISRRDLVNKGRLTIEYSDFFKKELGRLRTISKRAKESLSNGKTNYDDFDRLYLSRQMLREALVDSLEKIACREVAFDQLFIPAGRSFFANLQSNIFSFLSNNNALDPFLREFGSIYENMKLIRLRARRRDKEVDEKEKYIREEINRLIEKSLCGKYIHEKGEDFLEVTDGRRISVANSSSGQQETLPLTIMLSMLPLLVSSAGRTVYIEEPEAHLFPDAQRNIVELIATVFNSQSEQIQFFITTHSPYVLTAFNNLLQAGILYKEPKMGVLDKLQKIISKYKSIDVSDLTAYALSDGECKNIICPETKLIDAKMIDSVSDELAIQFDELLELT